MGPFWMVQFSGGAPWHFPRPKAQLNHNRHTSCMCLTYLSPGANGPVLTNPNMSLNILERYKSGGNSSDESFVAILGLVFLCGFNGIEFNSDRWVCTKAPFNFFIQGFDQVLYVSINTLRNKNSCIPNLNKLI